jgi:phospholipase/carboxylesterase
MMLTDYRIPPANGGKPNRAVIFLHGVGDSGSGGLLTIGQMWQRDFPDCEFVCPDAPFPYDMAPADFGGRQWFSLQSFAPEKILEGVKAAAPILDSYIDHVLETRDLTPDKLALVGFSQGTMMALYAALRRPAALSCVLGYSGALVGAETLAQEKKSAPPVLLVHGMLDEVVPFGAMELAERALKAAGVPVTVLAAPHLGHSIDDAGIAGGLKFLKTHLHN